MFDVSLSELFLVAIIALVVLGPQRLPEVARAAGRWAGKLRRFVEDVKRDIDRETGDHDLAALRQIHQELNDTRGLLERSAQEAFTAVNEIRDSAAGATAPASAPPAALAVAASAAAEPAAAAPKTTSKKRAPKKKRRKAATGKRHVAKRSPRR